MKFKCNLFGLLSRGVTATHPLCSVFILAIIFVFLSFSISVSADSSYSNLPISDSWQFGQALDGYNSLTLEQQKISNFLVGCQGNAYAGLANYSLQNDYPDFSSAVNGVSNFGKKIWENLVDAYQFGYNIGAGIRNKLSNFLGSTIEYSSSINVDFNTWLGNIGLSAGSSSSFRIGYDPQITNNYINYFGDSNLYEWQYSSNVISKDEFGFEWNVFSGLSASQELQFYNEINNLPGKVIKANCKLPGELGTGNYSVYLGSTGLNTYSYIFLNTTTNICQLVNSLGDPAPSSSNANIACVRYTGPVNIVNISGNIMFKSINANNYSSLQSLFDAINYNNLLLLDNNLGIKQYDYKEFINGMYIGSSWEDKAVWTRDFDLNFAPVSNYVTVYTPNQPIYLNIVGFINDLYDNDKTIKKSVEDNSIISDGTPILPDIWDTISNYFTRPESGIHIGLDFFKLPDGTSPLFDTYIADLWRNTKDMVLYCGDILKVFTLNDGGGLAYVVYGAIGVGVIGGIFSKFLL